MSQIICLRIRLINMIKTYRFLSLIGILFLSINSVQLSAQEPLQAIRELKEGILVVRFPAYKSKIDTLTSMISRSGEDGNKKRLQMLLDEALYQRDSVRLDYIRGFQNLYDFSKVAYFYDHESRNLSKAHFYRLDGSEISFDELGKQPVYYLSFEKSEESKNDALIIYDRNMKRVPAPFPNNFSRGGFSFLFVKLSTSTYPEWRVKKINRKLHKFWEEVN